MRKTIADFSELKKKGRKITMLTAYDAGMARLFSGCDVDMLLVGDSLGMVVLGYENTVPVTMEEMLHHARATRRGAPDSFIVGDMPFGSYQTGWRDAVQNALRFVKEADCDAVKLEGGVKVCPLVNALVDAGISVMGHIGLTPQTASQLGGFKVQGKDLADGKRLLEEAQALEDAGAFAMILECVPDSLAEVISNAVTIPTVGIGAGHGCDGQVLVSHDLLGLFDRFTPKFVRQYANLAPLVTEAVKSYLDEVRGGAFPTSEHSFTSSCDYSVLVEK